MPIRIDRRPRKRPTSSDQPATEQLREWILEQARAGCAPETIVDAMRAAGWDESVALQALETTLRSALAATAASTAPMPAASAVPEPDLSSSASRSSGGDREFDVLLAIDAPRIVVFGGFLSADECDALVATAAPRLARSETVDNLTGDSGINAARTSSGMFFERAETPLIERIETRIATALRWPVDHGEGLQVLHYRSGAEYRPHYDWFDPAQPGTAALLVRGGQRVATLVMYLNTPRRGGATTFPDLGLSVGAVKGNAVFFSYDRPHSTTKTLHGGAPVISGEKWVATKWLREGVFR